MAWQIDSAHSQVEFSVRHMMISNVRGRFENLSGTVEFDEANPARSTVDVKIDAAGINTRDPRRDGHLKSPDFLDAEKYPYLTFKSKRGVPESESTGKIVGYLTIRDVTREVVLDVYYSGLAKSPWGTMSAGFSAETRISRKDWDLNWTQALETGGVLVGDEIKIVIELEGLKQGAPVAAGASV